MVEQVQTTRRSLPTGVIVGLVLLVLVGLLWLPFGANVGFTRDGWMLFHQADAGIAMASGSLLRLFVPIPWMIGYALAPQHFSGINGMLALLILGKSELVYLILRRLKMPLAPAFAAAALVILVPADTGIFYMGALAIHFAVFCYLLALYLLTVYWRTGRLSVLLAMGIAQAGAVATYELVYPLVLFSPLILLLLERTINRRVIRMTLLWYVVPVLNAVWYVYIIVNYPHAFGYQNGLVDSLSIPTLLTSLWNIYQRHFLTAWVAPANPAYLPFAISAGVLVLGTCLWLMRREQTATRSRAALIFTVSGLALIGLGVALYLPTSLRNETQRTYYISSIGAALTLAAGLWWAVRRPLIFSLLVGVLAGLGVLQLLDQHQRYADESKQQQAVFTELVRLLPNPSPNSGIIVIDETAHATLAQLIESGFNLEYILPLLYTDYSLEAEICLPDDLNTSEQAHCHLTEDGLYVPSIRTRVFFRSYAKLIFVRYDGSFHVVSDISPYVGDPVADYQPGQLYQPGGALPARLTDLFGL